MTEAELLERWTPTVLGCSDLLHLAGGGDWKGMWSRSTDGARRSPDVAYTSDAKGRHWTEPERFTLTWSAMAAYARPLLTEELVARLKAAQRRYSDVCMEPSARWGDWQRDPLHAALLHQHQRRYARAVAEMDAAVAAVFARADEAAA